MAADEKDKVLHELDGIQEYDNPLPGWLMAIWWGSLLFAALYVAFYALSFGEGSMEAEYRSAAEKDVAAIQAHFDANPLVPPTPAQLLAGAVDPQVLEQGAARFAKSCAPCHGERAQGLIGPNLTDDRWIHGGQVEQVFQSVAKGWPAKGMPPWGRAVPPEELVRPRVLRAQPPGIEPSEPEGPRGRPGRARAPAPELA